MYAEYGVHEDWTAVVHARPVGWARYGEESTLFSGMTEVGARRALLRDPLALAVEARVGAALAAGHLPEVIATTTQEGSTIRP